MIKKKKHCLALILINLFHILVYLLFPGWGKWRYDHSYPRLLTVQRKANSLSIHHRDQSFLMCTRRSQPTVLTALTTVSWMTVWLCVTMYVWTCACMHICLWFQWFRWACLLLGIIETRFFLVVFVWGDSEYSSSSVSWLKSKELL